LEVKPVLVLPHPFFGDNVVVVVVGGGGVVTTFNKLKLSN
jgi:hypothetical protein